MKKIFKLTSPKLTSARQVDAVKHEIKKYITRERNKKVAEGSDFWDFDCKFGDEPQAVSEIKVNEINKSIDNQVAQNKESFYIEILSRPGYKINKTKKLP